MRDYDEDDDTLESEVEEADEEYEEENPRGFMRKERWIGIAVFVVMVF